MPGLTQRIYPRHVMCAANFFQADSSVQFPFDFCSKSISSSNSAIKREQRLGLLCVVTGYYSGTWKSWLENRKASSSFREIERWQGWESYAKESNSEISFSSRAETSDTYYIIVAASIHQNMVLNSCAHLQGKKHPSADLLHFWYDTPPFQKKKVIFFQLFGRSMHWIY